MLISSGRSFDESQLELYVAKENDCGISWKSDCKSIRRSRIKVEFSSALYERQGFVFLGLCAHPPTSQIQPQPSPAIGSTGVAFVAESLNTTRNTFSRSHDQINTVLARRCHFVTGVRFPRRDTFATQLLKTRKIVSTASPPYPL